MRSNKTLNRKRVNNELKNILEYPLTIVSAAMGYGKTTSVKNYLSGCKADIVWIASLGSDGSEGLFWSKFAEGFKRIDEEIGEHLFNLGFPLDSFQVEVVIDIITKTINRRCMILVIEDYHIVENSNQVVKVIENIVQAEIRGLHIVLTSRTNPKLNYINLISKGLCYYIQNDTLAFTIEEIKEYFKIMNVHITNREISKIYCYTRGWISGIYLMLIGLRKGIPVTEISSVDKLVYDNLYCNFDEETKKILLQLSVFHNFTARQAVWVFENLEVAKVISKLAAENAFVEFNIQTGFYKIHNVLLDFLRRRLEITDINVKDICYRTGQWYMENGDIINAFHYYHRGGKIEELLEKVNSMEQVDMSYLGLRIFYSIYEEIPHELYKRYPYPFLQFASSFVVSGEEALVKVGIKIVEDMRNYYNNHAKLTRDVQRRILGELDVISIFIVFNDCEKMIQHGAKAYELLDGGVSKVILSNNEFTLGLPHFTYIYYKEAGRFKEIVDFIVNGFPLVVLNGCGTGCDYGALAEYSLETGRLAEVEFYANKAIYKANTKMQIGIILSVNFTIMRLYIMRGEILKTRKLLIETKDMLIEFSEEMTAQNKAIYNTTVDMCEGYIYGCLGEIEKIPRWLLEGDISSRIFMYEGMAFPYIIYGKAIMLSGNWVKLETLCENFKSKFAVFNNQLGVIHNLIYEAVAKTNLYGIKIGTEVLLLALSEAEKDEIIFPFGENADYILPMLYELRKHSKINNLYLENVIDISESYSKSISKARKNNLLLTKREIEVLKLLAQGLTQREMASELFVSVSSIKRYTESIYQKLVANNKIVAVENAKKLNIL